MKKKWLPMALAVAAIALLGGGYLALEKLNSTEEEVEVVEVPMVSGEVDSIEYTLDTGNVSLVKDGDVWQWSQDAEFPLMQDFPQAMASQGQTIDATSLVRSDGEELSTYGLDEPSKTIVLKSGEETVTCLIGDLNNYTGEYYMMLEGGKEIYTVSASFYSTFSYDLYDMIVMEQWPVTSVDDVRSVEYEGADGTTLSLAASENEDGTLSYQVNGSEADTTAAQDYIREFTYLTITECANYKASDDELSTYGLDAPAAVIQIRWEESDEDGNTASDEITLTVGASDGNGGYYVRVGDSQAVNVMSGEELDWILSPDASDFEPEADVSSEAES